ncbi:MAG: hypothetical protein IJ459_04530 [Clostridia bacterium]|nr:hypothetical protein [Clostridia bacterium]
MDKKYTVNYCSGSTGFGWSKQYDRLDEFEDFVDEMRREYTARVVVWDETLQGFVFWKDCLSYDPSIDLLHAPLRDMRTTTRKSKGAAYVYR